MKTQDEIEDFYNRFSESYDLDDLIHYASPYYDPVKAHEYYMMNRELKGKRSASSLDDSGKEIWSYTKSKITEEKKEKEEKLKTDRDEKIQAYRDQAKQSREHISERLKELNDALSSKAKNNPNNHGPGHASTLQELQEQNIGKTRIYNKRSSANEKKAIAEQKKKNREDASEQRKKVSEDLRNAVAGVREAYKKAKEELKQKYENIYQQEFDSIHAQYSKK